MNATPRVAGTQCPADYAGNDQECYISPSAPHYNLMNFNDIQNSIIALFTTATLEGWVENMNLTQDAVGDVLPAVFFIFLVIVCNFVIWKLGMSIVLDNYNGMRLI